MSRADHAYDDFIKVTAKHEMEVVLDKGEHRHIGFCRPNGSAYHFSLITWPGHLCISGDMGTYVFSRIVDMFSFFRSKDHKINAYYWSEKIESKDSRCGVRKYSEESFREAVKKYSADWVYDNDEERDVVKEELEELLQRGDDGECRAYDAANDFTSSFGHKYGDFWEAELRDFTYQYIWCCHAIVYGIQQYDLFKLEEGNSNHGEG